MNIEQARASQGRDHGFSLPELLLIVAILSITAGITIPHFTRNLQSERMGAATKLMAAWLDDARREAIRQSRPCRIQINSATAQLIADDCNSITTIDLAKEVGGNPEITINSGEDNSIPLSFSFTPRGTIYREDSSNSIELRLSINNATIANSRCIKIMIPVGLIRAGRVIEPSEIENPQCDYTTAL